MDIFDDFDDEPYSLYAISSEITVSDGSGGAIHEPQTWLIWSFGLLALIVGRRFYGRTRQNAPYPA